MLTLAFDLPSTKASCIFDVVEVQESVKPINDKSMRRSIPYVANADFRRDKQDISPEMNKYIARESDIYSSLSDLACGLI